jgi:ADP-ribose pyrophosphatase YjhB (NUDIX family)
MINCEFENGNKDSLRHVVVDCLVLKGEEILLVKRAAGLLEGGKWALPGGFVDRDETIEQAAAREIMEETGYKVENISLLRIIDNPARHNEDRQNVSFVYSCAAREKTGMADSESDQQKWFPLAALPPENEIAFDHMDFIKLYKEYIKNH